MKNIKIIIQKRFSLLYKMYLMAPVLYGKKHQKWLANYIYKKKFHKNINWDNPHNINEKINWLKFHVNPQEWSYLADKYRVRDYVRERLGDEENLVPIYGKWDTVEGVFDSWEILPDEFVLKCNNGCGNIVIVDREHGGKEGVDNVKLQKELDKWIKTKDYGLSTAEPHYSLIKNCIYAEKLLKDNRTSDFSRSLVDYKVWCFDGNPYGILIVYDRDIETGYHILDYYDTNWERHTEYLTVKTMRKKLKKPENLDLLIEIARKLSKGLPQVRVDLYDIDGKIYFGEMTMTSLGGYMDYFTDDVLQKMGERIDLDYSLPWNEFV